MLKSRAGVIGLVLVTLLAVALFRGSSGATASPKPSTLGSDASQNKFVAVWHSHITYGSGQQVSDGDLDITESSPATSDRVSVSHSLRGGRITGYTMSYPDRIEIQIPLGNSRVAHYNGVLVSADRIEGRFFVTQDQSRYHGRNRSVLTRTSRSLEEEDGMWVATKP